MKVEYLIRLRYLQKIKKVFSLQDIVLWLSEEKNLTSEYAKVILSRAVKKGLLARICKGWYFFPDVPPSPEEAVLTIVPHSYVSAERALSLEGTLSQGIFVITVITPHAWHYKRGFIIKYPDGTSYAVEFYLPPADDAGEFVGKVAPPEVALRDFIYLYEVVRKKYLYLQEILDNIYFDEIDRKTFLDRVKRGRKAKAVLRILLEIIEKFFPLKAYQRKLSESCLQQAFL